METEQQEETFTNTETNGKFFKGLFFFGKNFSKMQYFKEFCNVLTLLYVCISSNFVVCIKYLRF